MQEYVNTKEANRDCILMYRVGDFFEMFFDDALTVSKELELTLTGKECGLPERAPMCGVPYHAVETYIGRLVKNGHKVAVCDQVEDPKQAKGLVRREITRIVTPGTNFDASAMEEGKNNYLVSIMYAGDNFGIASCDASTGEFFVTETDRKEKFLDEIYKLSPSEMICNEAFLMSGTGIDDLKARF
ncbi:MAG: DNA mismatch repair protein MutS, partial [Lachnospiraceae bacterium]|nr:DNA mismatch repair protein MutS [Lachnospiraceae bacterium]